MRIDLYYDNGTLPLEFPDTVQVDRFSPRTVGRSLSFGDFSSEFKEAGGERFLAHPEPLVIVNDGYRSTPTADILDRLNEMDSEFIDKVRFLIATGSHQAPTEQQMGSVFGHWLEKVRRSVHVHDALDKGAMKLLGADSLGGQVWLNRQVMESQATLIIGSVEPHYFAGFTGGRKALFPGLMDLASIERNHNLANSLKAAPLKLEGNPVAEHLDELLALVPLDSIFAIQLVQDAGKNLAGCFCGSLRDAFQLAVSLAREIYSCRANKLYDLVIAEILPPLDKNLYQAQKALENCQNAVKHGGGIVLVSACNEGVGSDHFFELAANWDREKNVIRDGRLHFGSHKLSRVNLISRRISIRLVSNIDAEIARRVYYEPLDNLQKFVYSTNLECEKNNIAVVRDAAHTVLTT